MSKLIVLSGVPGSGKSHFAKALLKKKKSHVYIISSDDLRRQICGIQSDLSRDSLVWKMFYGLARVYSSDPEGIIVLDSTNIYVKYRVDLTRELKPLFDETDLVMWHLDPETVKKQNREREFPISETVLENFLETFELPTEKDKDHFDRIFLIESRDIGKVVDELI